MKRIFTFVLTLLLAAACLASCAMPTDYESFHAKALEAAEAMPEYTSVKVVGQFCIDGDIEEINATFDVENGVVEIDTKTSLDVNAALKYSLEARIYLSNVINKRAYAIGDNMVKYKAGNGFEASWSRTLGSEKQTADYEFDKYGFCTYEKETIGQSYAEITLSWS